MQKRGITRKSTLTKKIPEKRMSKICRDESFSPILELPTDPRPSEKGRKSLLLSKNLKVTGTLSPRSIPSSLPFGPKTISPLLPSKDLSENSQVIEMDALENYNIWSDIGRGSYATVKLATNKSTMQKCAIKIYTKKSLEDITLKKNVKREIKILKKIDHPNIVKFYEEINGKNNLYIVMEYVKGISLGNHLQTKSMKRLDEVEACSIFTQLISGLEYCHNKNITHRDIKLENIQLDLSFNVKLIDFGFATCYSHAKKSVVVCGSPCYMAPEIINKQEFVGPPVDIWAAGVVLFTLVTGVLPFKSFNENRVFQKVKQGKFQVPEYVSPLCKELIHSILKQNPEERLTATQILNHFWIKNAGNAFLHCLPLAGDNSEVIDEEVKI